jgi:hypothetical protein
VDRSLGFTVDHQQENYWCWAATTVGISRFLNSSFSWNQCDLANNALHQGSCCMAGAGPLCNVTLEPWKALQCVGHFASTVDNMPDFGLIVQELSARRPISVLANWRDGSGAHNFAISGFDNSNPASPKIDIEDPLYGSCKQQDFNTFGSTYAGRGIYWVETYLTKY